jgi:hypothetical protein
MHEFDGTSTKTPGERLQVISALFARGLLKLHSRATLPRQSGAHPPTRNPSESDLNCLEVSGKTVLSVHVG